MTRITEAPCVSCVHVDSVRSKRCYTLSQLAQLPLLVPEIQRPADLQRVEEIVQYHANTGGGNNRQPVLIGDLIVAHSQDGDAWVVDGQHRWLAYQRLAPVYPDAAATVELIRLGVEGAPTMAELFKVVNRSVPVPDYVIKAVLDGTHRQVLDQFGRMVEGAFAPFASRATNPRRPNISVPRLLDRLAESVALQQLGDAASLFEYLRWTSERLGHRDIRNTERANAKAVKHKCEPLYITSDADDAWMSDPVALLTFLAQRRPKEGGSTPTAAPRPPSASLPSAVRLAVWNEAFGDDAGKGKCVCCSAAVTQQTFECGHVVPRAKGGTDATSNLRVVCRKCNRSMGTRNLFEFKAEYFSESHKAVDACNTNAAT